MRVLPLLAMAGSLAAPGTGAPPRPEQASALAATSRTPSSEPHPDTAFARAPGWESGEAEILAYAVKRGGPEGGMRCHGRLITERLFLRSDGTTAEASGARGETEILNAALSMDGDSGAPFSVETVCQFPRAGNFKLLRQEQGLLGRSGTTHRSLDCRLAPPRLRICSSGGDAPRDTILARWPVYTEEMLFTYLRAIPLREGYREEVWLHDWSRVGGLEREPRYAVISVGAKESGIRDMEAWHITVDRDDGRDSEFWVGAAGLHPVIVATLADGTEWTLQGISREKHRSR